MLRMYLLHKIILKSSRYHLFQFPLYESKRTKLTKKNVFFSFFKKKMIAPNESQLEELLAWVDEIPLSRKKKNLPRDFSDAVLMAEICAHFYPKLVDLFNYDQGLKLETKTYNWNTLNTRVLSKLKMPLDKETISELANARGGTIEKVLWCFKQNLEERKEEEQKPYFDNLGQDPDFEELEAAQTATDRSLLEAKIKECQDQAQRIDELNAKIAKVEELIKQKDATLSKLLAKPFRHM